MIIDCHQHVFWHGRDDKGLVADMDEQGIDRAWLLSWDQAPFEDDVEYHRVLNPLSRRADGTMAGVRLSDLILARDRYPQRFWLGYCPHPLLGDAPAIFESAHRIHGVRICGEWKFRIPFDDPRCLNLYRRAGELGCPVVLHLDVPYLPDPDSGQMKYMPSWYGGTVANLQRALEACDQTNFIGHAPGFWREISGDADASDQPYPTGPITAGGRLYDLLDRYRNLFADLSASSARKALERDSAHARSFLCRYADRLLFGRDFYGGKLNEFLQSLDLPRDVGEKIYGLNALRLCS